MSSFSDAITAGLTAIASVAGEVVTYWRGSGSVRLTNAVPGSSQIGTDTAEDQRILARSRDWIVSVAELVINGSAIVPQRGDQIRQTIAGTTTVYEVVSNGDQVFRFSDRGRTRYRIHTEEMTNG